MTDFFEITDTESAINYIKEFSPSVYERLLVTLKLIDETSDNENLKHFRIKKKVNETVFETFKLTGKDVVFVSIINQKMTLERYFTNEKEIHVDGKYKLIYDNCFSECPNLETIVFEEGVEGIFEAVLTDNETLKSVDFPEILKWISGIAFKNCNNLVNVIFRNNKTHIFRDAFEGTKWFEEKEDEFVVINRQLLRYNGQAKNVVVPEGVTNLSCSVFNRNKYIRKLICPSSLKSIEAFAVANCYELQEVILNEGVEVISIGAFENCGGLEKIVLPDSLREIGCMAFSKKTMIVYSGKNAGISEYIKETYSRYQIGR